MLLAIIGIFAFIYNFISLRIELGNKLYTFKVPLVTSTRKHHTTKKRIDQNQHTTREEFLQ